MRWRFLIICFCTAATLGCSERYVTFVAPPQVVSFTSSANMIFLGDSTLLNPVFSGGAGSIDNGIGAVTSGIAYSISPSADRTYTLTVTNGAGATATAQLVIHVDSTPVTIAAFASSPEQVNYGESSTLSWTIAGRATTLTLDRVSVLGQTSQNVLPVRRQTYVLVGSNAAGADRRSVVIAARGLDLLAGDPTGGGYRDETGSAARFSSPNGAAVDGSGNIYVADTGNNCIRKMTPAGVVTTLAGRPGNPDIADGTGPDARFNYPRGVAIDASGNVYVADTQNYTIRKITPAGVVSTWAGAAGVSGSTDGSGRDARFFMPMGIALDGAGNVYVADSFNNTIRKITPAGIVSTLAGAAGSLGDTDGIGRDARFRTPYGLAVDASGIVYVADTDNHTIRRISAEGEVSTLAGLAGYTGATDGAGRDARFNWPSGVTADNSGNAYVADSSNATIRKVSPAGVVTTIAGTVRSYGIRLGPLPASSGSPYGIVLTPEGDLIVTGFSSVLQITAF